MTVVRQGGNSQGSDCGGRLRDEIFKALKVTLPGKGGEIQLTDALQVLARERSVYAYEFEGRRYDVGTPLGLLRASVTFGLQHPNIGSELKKYLQELV